VITVASDFKVYKFPLLFFKRISDVYDEEFRNALKESDGYAHGGQIQIFTSDLNP
jgi:type I restriction-modification system DNA methylase subunit